MDNSSSSFLLVAPNSYDVKWAINDHMHPERRCGRPNKRRAWLEWNNLVSLLVHTGAGIEIIQQKEGLYDMVFAANAGLTVGPKKVVLSFFRKKERQPEQAIFRKHFEEGGWRVLEISRRIFFEGQGDALFWGDELVVGYGKRTEKAAALWLERHLERDTLALWLADPRWYHLDTCFAPMSRDTALYYPGAFGKESVRLLREFARRKGRNLIAITEKDALAFICNLIPIGKTLLIPTPSRGSVILETLRSFDFIPLPLNMQEFRKSGGAARCLVFNKHSP